MKMQQSGGLLLATALGGNTEIESNPSISAHPNGVVLLLAKMR